MPLPDIQLDPMKQDDIDEAACLVSISMNENEGEWAKNTMRFHFDCKEHGLDDGRSYFVWKPDEIIKGLAGLHHYVWGPKENVWLSWFAVDPECQGQGIGQELLLAIEETARGMGYTKFLVETYEHADFDKARAFYTTNGFEKVGSIADYLPEGSEMVVYGKRIAPPT